MPKPRNLTETPRVRIDIRLPEATHAAVAQAAADAGLSINSWATMVLGLAAGSLPDLATAIEVFGPGVLQARKKRRRAS